MSHNRFGKIFSVTTFGESHGPAIGCVIDGCPPGLEISEADFVRDLERRLGHAERREDSLLEESVE